MLPLLILLAITSAECILLAFIPAINLITTILWGATLIISGIYLSRSQLIIVFLVNLAMLFLVLGLNSALIFMLFFGGAGLTMSYLANCNNNYYFIQRSGVIAAVIGITIFMIFFYYGSNQVEFSERQDELNKYMQEAINDFESSDLYQIYEEQGITKEEIQESFDEMVIIMFNHLPALFYIQAIMVIFFMLFIAQRVSQTYAKERLRKKAFIREIMPWQLVWIFIAGLGLWMWGREQASTIYYLGSNMLAIISPIALYFGLSFALHILSKIQMKKNIWLMVMVLIFILIFTVPVIILLVIIGLFDALIDYRKLRLQEEV